jgi:hypothetical protein
MLVYLELPLATICIVQYTTLAGYHTQRLPANIDAYEYLIHSTSLAIFLEVFFVLLWQGFSQVREPACPQIFLTVDMRLYEEVIPR